MGRRDALHLLVPAEPVPDVLETEAEEQVAENRPFDLVQSKPVSPSVSASFAAIPSTVVFRRFWAGVPVGGPYVARNLPAPRRWPKRNM